MPMEMYDRGGDRDLKPGVSIESEFLSLLIYDMWLPFKRNLGGLTGSSIRRTL